MQVPDVQGLRSVASPQPGRGLTHLLLESLHRSPYNRDWTQCYEINACAGKSVMLVTNCCLDRPVGSIIAPLGSYGQIWSSRMQSSGVTLSVTLITA